MSLDAAREKNPPIESIDLIVVSGDLVHGVRPDSPEDDLRAQYSEATAFLAELTNNLLDGRRDRVVIVPGNHDVSFPAFMSSLSRVDVDDKGWSELYSQLFEPDSEYRWHWRERALYRISDLEKYRRRLGAFADFYSDWYEGLRRFELDPTQQFEIFDYPELELMFVGFSSCYMNDPWHTIGHIDADTIAAFTASLRSQYHNGRVQIGVWHHSISAPPHHPDYMDEGIVQVLIAHGLSVGLHGHQHRPEKIQLTSRFGQGGQIAVISAGTLCGGTRALPPGRPRSFNVVEIDSQEEEGFLHVFHMANDMLNHPIWTRRPAPGADLAQVFPVRLMRPPGAKRAELMVDLDKARGLITAGNLSDARELLEPLASDGTARRLLVEVALRSDDSDLLVDILDPPRSNQERIHLLGALWERRDTARIAELLESPEIRDSTDHSMVQTREVMRRRLDL